MNLPKPKLVIPLLILVAGALVTAALVSGRKPPERASRQTAPPVVRVQTVVLEDARLDVRSQGTVEPRTETRLTAQVGGQITEISPHFFAGERFTKGEMLARIDPTDYRLALRTAEAGVARARLVLAQQEKEAEIARRDWTNLGMEGEPDPLVLRQPQLAQARAELASAEALVEKAQVDLERTRIRALYDGRVRDRVVDVGQFVAPGTPLGVIYATDAAEIRLPVPADEIAFVPAERAGAGRDAPEVVFRADLGGTWHEWTGRLVRTEGAIDPRTRMVNVVARVEDPFGMLTGDADVPLVVGLFVEAEIEGRTFPDVVVLPRSALRGKDGVLVVDAEDRLRPRTVDVLRVDRDRAVIRSGLEAGELVCLSPIEVAVDGMPVRVERPGKDAAIVGVAQPAAVGGAVGGADGAAGDTP